MSTADARSLRAGVCWPRIPARALISRDAADTRIPAVRRCLLHIMAYQRCLPPALYSACLLRAGVRWHGTPARAGVFMTIISHETPTAAVWAGAHLPRSPRCQLIPIPCVPYSLLQMKKLNKITEEEKFNCTNFGRWRGFRCTTSFDVFICV